MEVFVRVISILIEILILSVLIYALLKGVWLFLFDIGLAARYRKALTMLLVLAGSMAVVFFISHLFSFYPAV